jgi:cytochrome c oxidase subunit 1
MDWLTTVDHKKIGIMYLIAGTVFLVIAGIEALLIRIQLMFPLNDFLDGQTFNEIITMHGATMLFLAAAPLLFGFMNFVVPLQIGARDVAFPFLNALGFWTFLAGGILLNLSFFLGGAPDAGWTAYTPLSTEYSGTGMDFFVIGLQISGIGTLLSGINFLVTIINMRAPGMTFMRLPLFTWTSFIMSLLILFAFTALAVGLVLITFDRLFDANFFRVGAGGNTVLWQHIFWIFGHPEVYILIMPAFGIISEVIPVFAKKRLFGYSSMVFAVVLIGFLSFMVWVHHMFTDGLGPVANALFGVATMLIAIPTGIKVFNWLFTMWGGQLTFNTASLFAYSFIPTFVVGGVTGVMLASPPADYQYHDTYFVVGHFHYVIVGGIVLALFSGLFYWYPKMFGRKLHEGLGKAMFWIFYIGFHLTFFIQHFLGLWGMPRRVYTYLPDQGWDIPNLISSIGAFMMGIGVVLLVINIIITHARKAEPVPSDPWDARTMEWAVPTPVPEYNFKQTPLVRGLDAFWKEKMAGNKEMTPAEPIGPIHMPNGSIIPLIMSVGIFILGVGIMYANTEFSNSFLGTLFNNHIVTAIGFIITFGSMVVHSLYDDPGYHIEVDQLEDKGVKA